MIVTMWHCDILTSCPEYSPAFALDSWDELQQPPATLSVISNRDGNEKMDGRLVRHFSNGGSTRLWVTIKVSDVIVSLFISLLLLRLMPGLGPWPGSEPLPPVSIPPLLPSLTLFSAH